MTGKVVLRRLWAAKGRPAECRQIRQNPSKNQVCDCCSMHQETPELDASDRGHKAKTD